MELSKHQHKIPFQIMSDGYENKDMPLPEYDKLVTVFNILLFGVMLAAIALSKQTYGLAVVLMFGMIRMLENTNFLWIFPCGCSRPLLHQRYGIADDVRYELEK